MPEIADPPFVTQSVTFFALVPRFPSKSGLMNKHIVKHIISFIVNTSFGTLCGSLGAHCFIFSALVPV
jgi:hypothetical protein